MHLFLGFDGLGMEVIDSPMHDVSVRRKQWLQMLFLFCDNKRIYRLADMRSGL